MKKYFLLLMVLCYGVKAFSFDPRIRLGLFVAPGVSWMKPMGSEIHNGVAEFGLQYGLKVEYFFKDQNYAISTGLFGGIGDGGLKGRDTLTKLNGGKSVLEKYTTNNLILPCYLKLKTNPFKEKFKLFGEVGFQAVFNVSARANYSTSILSPYTGVGMVNIDKENVLRNGNEVQQLIPNFRYSVFDFRLSAGGGFEYAVGEKTSVFFEIHYNNGFVNITNDKSVNPKHDATVVRNVLFSIGAMF